MSNWIIGKLKEGSTWAGLAGIIGGLSFIPHANDIAKLVPEIGIVVAGVLAIIFP